MEHARLQIETINAVTFCEDCKQEYETVKYVKICPYCQSENIANKGIFPGMVNFFMFRKRD